MIPPRIFPLQQDSLYLHCPITVAINPEWLFKLIKIKYNARVNSLVTPAPLLSKVLCVLGGHTMGYVAGAAAPDGVKWSTAILVEGSMTDSTVLDGFPAFNTQQRFEIFGNYILKEGCTANILNLRHI